MHHTSTVDVPAVKEYSRIAAEHSPDTVAFGNGIDGRTVTWSEFDERSRRAANGFREYVGQGDRIAFLCGNSVEHTVLLNGALKAGCTVSNLHVRASPNTVRHCIDSLRPRVLVVDESTSEFFEERVRDGITTDLDAVVTAGEPKVAYEKSISSLTAGTSATEPDVRVNEDDVAVVMWTSGTTGEPKGWCHTNRSLFVRSLVLSRTLEIDRPTRQPNVFTPSFAAWYSVVLPAMLSGGTTYFIHDWDPEVYLRAIDEKDMTTALLVPTMWREILRLDDRDDYDTSSLEVITSAGERLDTTTLSRLREHICGKMKNMYAATEAIASVITDAELDAERIESVGKPVQGAEVRVVDRDGSYEDVKPPGEVGELVVRARDCPVWAWGRTQKTEDTFENGWWYTGDLGYKDDDGYLYLEGRTDFMILSKGIKVYPTPVEERLNAHPGVEESAVFGVDDEEYGERVTAVVHRSDPDVTAEDLDEWCLESDDLARMERPRTYHFLDEPLPRTASGKLDRRGARELT